MSKEDLDFGSLIASLYTVSDLSRENNSNFKTPKHLINYPPEQKIKDPLNRRSLESICLSDPGYLEPVCLSNIKYLSNPKKITNIYSKILLNNPQEIINPIKISKERNYNSLENIIMSKGNN